MKSPQIARFLGATVIPVYIVSFVALQDLSQSVVFDPPGLLLVLNTVFLTAICSAVLYIARKSFLMGGPLSLLFLGGGMFAYGVSGFAGALIFYFLGVNSYVTVYNVGVLFSAALTFIAAALTTVAPGKQMGSGHRGFVVALVLLGVLVFNLAVAGAFFVGVIPVFFVQGVGSTMLRQVVIATALVLFSLSSILLMMAYIRAKSRTTVLYWYSLGLGLIALAFFATLFQTSFGGWVNWMGRVGWYLGTSYLLVAIWTALRRAGPLRLNKFLGVALAVAYLITVTALQALAQNAVFDSPTLLFVLNTVFLSAIPLVVTYISRKSFLMSGSLTPLFLGGGMFALGVSGLLAGLMLGLLGINGNETVFSIGVLFSALLIFVASVLAAGAPGKQTGSNHKGSVVALTLLFILVFNIAVTAAVFAGVMPVFFVQGVGSTLLREVVLTAAIILFAISCVLFIGVYNRSRGKTAAPYWFSLGIGLFAYSLLAASSVTVTSSLLSWAVRAGLYLGMVYLLVAIGTTFVRAESQKETTGL